MSSSITGEDRRTVAAGSGRMVRAIILVLLLGAAAGLVYWGSISGGNVLTDDLLVPLDGATTAKVDIYTGAGNLTIDRLASGGQVLANGTLQYLERQGIPRRSVSTSNGHAVLTLRGGDTGQTGFSFPWAVCNAATKWQVQLNPGVRSDITAHSSGGNVKVNLAGMAVTRASADSGAGNVDMVLPDNASSLNAKASTGAGNVTVDLGNDLTGSNTVSAISGAGNVAVRIPSGIAARVRATGGLGKVDVDPRFSKLDGNTYQSSDYDSANNKVDISVNSGAGNVSVETK